MERIDGRKLSRWSLRLDAISCTLLGASVALLAAPIAEVVVLPEPFIAAGSLLAVAGVLAIAVDIALFAGSQALALRKLPTAGAV